MLENFGDWQNQNTMEVQERVTVKGDDGRPTTTWTTVEGLDAVPVWTYRDSTSRALVGDRFKVVAKLHIVLDPADLGDASINGRMRGVIDGRAWYFNEPEDVMGTGELMDLVADGEDHI